MSIASGSKEPQSVTLHAMAKAVREQELPLEAVVVALLDLLAKTAAEDEALNATYSSRGVV